MKHLSENRIPSPDNYRKVSKPLIEKKRRARINSSLGELKSLLETVLGADIPRDSKMEKADILELAVRHLRRLNKQQYRGSPVGQYRSGYGECASETSRFLATAHGPDSKLRSRLMNHLACTVNQTAVNSQQMTSQNVLTPRNVWTQSSAMTSPSSNMTSTNTMTPQMTSHRYTNNANIASPIFVKVSEPNSFRKFQPIMDKENYVTMTQPMRNVQKTGLLMAVPSRHAPEPKVWRPW